jgi:hypothetical protein
MRYTITILFLLALSAGSYAQNPNGSPFMEITYIKAKTPNYPAFERNTWQAVNQEMVAQGHLEAWALYKLKYPIGSNSTYNYLAIHIYKNWEQILAPAQNLEAVLKKVKPGTTVEKQQQLSAANQQISFRQLFKLMGIAVTNEAGPSKYLMTNEVKSKPGQERDYIQAELKYFKPFHTERVKEGIMHNWALYKYELPYGDTYRSDYVTFNGYSNWADITKQNPPTAWKKAHGDLNFSEIHDPTVAKRATNNVECWELVHYIGPNAK